MHLELRRSVAEPAREKNDMRTLFLTALGAALAATALPVLADTTDVRWATTVVVAKQGDHCADDPNCMNRYHPEIPRWQPRTRATSS